MSSSVDFDFLKTYEPIFNSDARYIDIWGGRGRGGSHFVTDYFLFKMLSLRYFRGFFMRSVFHDIRLSLYQDFKDRVEEKNLESLFHFNDVEMKISCKINQNTINSKGFKKSSGNQTAKLKSLAGATDIIIEECEEVNEDEFNTLDVSIRTVKSSLHVFRVWNPPDQNHWLIKNYYNLIPVPDLEGYFTAIPKGVENHLSIFSTYHQNEHNLDDTFKKILEGYKITNPDFYYSNVKGYVSSGKKGRIFKDYKVIKELPTDERLYRVDFMDFGYSPDPTVIGNLYINIERKRLYIHERHRGLNMSLEQIYRFAKSINEENHELICDNAEKRERYALLALGLNIFESQKTTERNYSYRRSIRDLMNMFEIFIIDDDSIIRDDDSSVLQEFQNHTWALDAHKMPTGKPIDGWDHSIDGVGYALNYYIRTFGIQLN